MKRGRKPDSDIFFRLFIIFIFFSKSFFSEKFQNTFIEASESKLKILSNFLNFNTEISVVDRDRVEVATREIFWVATEARSTTHNTKNEIS